MSAVGWISICSLFDRLRGNVSLPGTVRFVRNHGPEFPCFHQITDIQINSSRLSRNANVLHYL